MKRETKVTMREARRKVFARLFPKGGRDPRDGVPWSISAEIEISGLKKKFLFLVLFLLAKGEKVQTIDFGAEKSCQLKGIHV